MSFAQRQAIKLQQERQNIVLVRKDNSKQDPSKKSVNLVCT